MSQASASASPGTAAGSVSAPASEENASPAGAATGSASGSKLGPPKARSCVVCRSRKVRCDKQSPCSNCRRANIACVVQANDRPPKWARRLERLTTNTASSSAKTPQEVGQVMDRLRTLENLVKELSGQLEQANAAVSSSSAAGGSSGVNSPESSTHGRDVDHHMGAPSNHSRNGMQKHFGRLVLHDAKETRYVSSGFWSRVSDELEGLKMDTRGLADGDSDSSDEEDSLGKTPSTQELGRTPSDRHAFLFRHNLSASSPDLNAFRPLPSEVPFLLSTFSENVNFFLQVVHIPTITKMLRSKRGPNASSLTPANDALVFSIYYAAVTSMEDDDVVTNFGTTKAELNLKYRLGFEHALARADFLNMPDLVLVQALCIFLFLVRRHDSPRFVWMMTGLVIRIAQAIGLHRDGSRLDHLTPFEVEMRRRAWWALCLLDIRASEDQGTEFTMTRSSFDTKLPLNINDADISPETMETPPERQAITDMTFPLTEFDMCDTTLQMMAPGVKGSALNLEEQIQLLNSLYTKLEHGYLQYSPESGSITYWVGVTATRLVVSKMTLFIYLPSLFSSPNDRFSEEIRSKLLVAAVEVAEYNHALNAEEACRQWRWLYQTYTHWHAIIYILIEILSRQWSPIVERAWVALHSSWLIPAQSTMRNNPRIWVPLRKMMAKARKHRTAELERLRGDASAITQVEMSGRAVPVPASSGPFPSGKSEDLFLQHWRSLFAGPAESNDQGKLTGAPDTRFAQPLNVSHGFDTPQQYLGPVYGDDMLLAAYQGSNDMHSNPDSATAMNPLIGHVSGQVEDTSFYTSSTVPAEWSAGQPIGPGSGPWLWADNDPTVDVFGGLDADVNMEEGFDWNNWIQSATGMETSMGSEGASGSWPTPG